MRRDGRSGCTGVSGYGEREGQQEVDGTHVWNVRRRNEGAGRRRIGSQLGICRRTIRWQTEEVVNGINGTDELGQVTTAGAKMVHMLDRARAGIGGQVGTLRVHGRSPGTRWGTAKQEVRGAHVGCTAWTNLGAGPRTLRFPRVRGPGQSALGGEPGASLRARARPQPQGVSEIPCLGRLGRPESARPYLVTVAARCALAAPSFLAPAHDASTTNRSPKRIASSGRTWCQ